MSEPVTTKESVTNAFYAVTKIYEESSFLLKDFSAILSDLKFHCVNSNSIEVYHGYSRGLDSPHRWLASNIELRFKPNKPTDNNRLISVTVSFRSFSSFEQPSEPYLIVGILENTEGPGWLSAAYHNEDGDYDYGVDTPPKDEWKEEQIIEFTFRENKDKKGRFFYKSLLQIKNTEEVKKLAGKIVKCWEGKKENTESG